MIKIKTALLSVYDKSGIISLAETLIKNHVEILSSGGTANFLKENGIEVTEVSDYTGSPEMFGGRVKTLHPKIHAGILARDENDISELESMGAKKIDLVVVNLYPFGDELKKPDATENDLIEKIDIGGPAMLRAAAKNYKNTVCVCDPKYYDEINLSGMTIEKSKMLAGHIFAHTSHYDSLVNSWMHEDSKSKSEQEQILRYGENPHQEASVTVTDDSPIDILNPLQGKEVSYNNVNDALAAVACVNEFAEPAVCIVKHANPCGVAESNNLFDSYKKAFSTDPTSAFGGVIALNQQVESDLAEYMIDNQFIEVIIAPSFSEDAKNTFSKKPNIRLLISSALNSNLIETKTSYGIKLTQMQDNADPQNHDIKIVSNLEPSDSEEEDLIFAMKVAKHVKSNAIVLAKNKMTIGIGAGQMSRVISTKIAFMKAKEEGLDASNCVLASDAFFPFRDNIDLAAENGAKHIIQPGGSIRDQEVIDAINENDMTMAVTGIRHFKH